MTSLLFPSMHNGVVYAVLLFYLTLIIYTNVDNLEIKTESQLFNKNA